MYYAEKETDKYIRETFFPNLKEKKTMVEVGAGPTEFYSMSKHFRDNGWRCICIDPNPKFVEQHKALNNEIHQYACSNEEKESIFNIVETGWEEKNDGISYSAIDIRYPLVGNYTVTKIPVKIIKLNTLLEELGVNEIDFISVDTEGWELDVMRGFDVNKYNPKVVLLENYLYSESYVEYMQSVGYSLAHKIDYNYIFTK